MQKFLETLMKATDIQPLLALLKTGRVIAGAFFGTGSLDGSFSGVCPLF